jgi:hypothetical protein
MPAGRPPILSGDRADGTQQRLRHGLGEHRPYRWRGVPGWNPASALDGERSKDRKDRACGKCKAQPGEYCVTRAGKPMHSTHTGR